MGFVVLHMEKAHGSDSGTTAHIERFIIPKNADPTRTHLNRKLVAYPDGIKDRSAAIRRRLEEAGLTRKIGNNQVRAIRINVSGTHEDMERIEREGRLDEWCADNMKYFADTFGKENIVAAHLHRDEETPHIHVTLVPIVKGERKRRKREEQAKKRYRKKPTDTVRLCADDIMTRLRLKSYQDTYAEAMAKYGLQRGIDGSKARHKSTQQYYNETKKLADSLKAEVVDLQRQKETAQEELRRTKKEIQTEKLKGAATTAAANIAESVGSLFGSNKVKTPERENAALHREVATHGEAIEALQTRIQTMQNDHHRERMELEAKNLSELSRKEAAHTEETTRLKNWILWQNHIIGCLTKQATSSARRYTALSVWQGIITSPVSIRSKYRTSRVSLTSSVMISSLTVQPGIFCILLPRRKANWITGSKSKPDGKSITW